MKWIIQYRIKGDNRILTEEVDVSFTNKREVKRWWISKSKTFVDVFDDKTVGGHRDDKEFINCHVDRKEWEKEMGIIGTTE